MSGIYDRLSSTQALSDITVFGKYAKHLPLEARRENYEEICIRNAEMHIAKYPELEDEIWETYGNFVMSKDIFPSMRSMQFGGRPIELANNRIYNCAYLPIEHPDAFSETMLLLLGGTGVGYSVQSRHVSCLPTLNRPMAETRRYLIGDSIEGWADAVKVLMESYFYGKQKVVFDYRDIRPKGAMLVTSGGKAPGHEPLQAALEKIRHVLEFALLSNVRKPVLTSLAAHDIQCHIADAVLVGGIRRAAMICLFDRWDKDMLSCKNEENLQYNPQRHRANNSVILKRGDVNYKEFMEVWQAIQDSGKGEPGIYWTNDYDWGTNPCVEIALRPYQFCNVTDINADTITSQEDLNERARRAAFIGTLQAGYTDFHYLRPIWKKTTEEDALIGVGITCIGSNKLANLSLSEAVEGVIDENKYTAARIGINPAARTTTIKPAGTTSLVAGGSSGVHAWHAPYYVRRMRFGKSEAIAQYLLATVPQLVEDDVYDATGCVVKFPQKAPEGAILRSESAIDLLERVKHFNVDWVRPGHNYGINHHNVSCTISVKEHEWDRVGEWMWDHQIYYNGIAVLPADDNAYPQMPFEDIDEAEYNRLLPYLAAIDISKVIEENDETDLTGEIACGANGCEIK